LCIFVLQDFVLAVHTRAASAGATGGMSKRAEIMLELVMDIKNNRLREGKASKAAAAAAAAAGKKGRGGAAAVLQPGLLKWIKQLGVDDVTLSNISWAKLVQPDKKGESSCDESWLGHFHIFGTAEGPC
jgi:nucleolar MIF4G domain-containing protein 1